MTVHGFSNPVLTFFAGIALMTIGVLDMTNRWPRFNSSAVRGFRAVRGALSFVIGLLAIGAALNAH